jgi:hypothetical protein
MTSKATKKLKKELEKKYPGVPMADDDFSYLNDGWDNRSAKAERSGIYDALKTSKVAFTNDYEAICEANRKRKKIMPGNGIDIIGDIHGNADVLRSLLDKMGYKLCVYGNNSEKSYVHPERRLAVFVGDFIDRGLQNLETVRIVRSMVESRMALAIMGNHEFNSILYHTEDPENPDEYLRPHTAKNIKQHIEFLNEQEDNKDEALDALKWFRTLPLYLDLPDCRVIHACWHLPSLETIRTQLDENNCMTDALLLKASKKGTDEYKAIEIILKGMELDLPKGSSFTDKDGHTRKEIRLKWWTDKAKTYREIAQVDHSQLLNIPETSLPSDVMGAFPQDKMTFIGHYWLEGEPSELSSNVVCLDYSIAKDVKKNGGEKGKLCAYRFGGSKNDSEIKSGWVSMQADD